ncbi:hypothetical protein GCG54_00015350 [Colletotrichum gloeosporioides]|uniref:Uncharacterized protein n=1 Tax=Colletotrichum gloeosporioides TaxID=474922 RepID=A0A8H4FEU6_COLGL|nr:uncharacterized protein GCG54_00015350 [Colletotrichum gloeosporioides]KAF3799161.1 hypothetical protein GCG54_00015350 [Colletotrichum gloeosporioides]
MTPASGGSNQGTSTFTFNDDAAVYAKATEDARLAEQVNDLPRQYGQEVTAKAGSVISLPRLADIIKVQAIDTQSEQAVVSAWHGLKHVHNDASTSDGRMPTLQHPRAIVAH